ncbi:MAG: maleylpyruvate isomerase [Actinomycetota bacterium]|nr:maleylpyruvate isomerase [Actinomycetota bacterium]
MDVDHAVAGCRAAHRRLFATIRSVDEATVRRPSRLPGWTVGHVLTHLARNADSHVRMLLAAERGETAEQYAGGAEQRAADIDAGAGRPRDALVTDVGQSAIDLEAVWETTSAGGWAGHGLSRGRRWPCVELPFRRWREVEVHHVDLGLGYEASDWPDDYVTEELMLTVGGLPGRVADPDQRRRLLAWLLDRGPQPALDLDGWGY